MTNINNAKIDQIKAAVCKPSVFASTYPYSEYNSEIWDNYRKGDMEKQLDNLDIDYAAFIDDGEFSIKDIVLYVADGKQLAIGKLIGTWCYQAKADSIENEIANFKQPIIVFYANLDDPVL